MLHLSIQTKGWLIPDAMVSVSVSVPGSALAAVLSPSCSSMCVCVWGSWECVSMGRGSVGSLPWTDTAADAGGFTLLCNPPLCCSGDWLSGTLLTVSPRARRGSRFWGRTEWPFPLFWVRTCPFWEPVDWSRPPGDVLELLSLGLLSFVLACARGGDWADGSPVGNSRSEKSYNQERKY